MSAPVIFHLPAISGFIPDSPRGPGTVPESNESWRRIFCYPMVSACGRKGPIIKRVEWQPTTMELPLFPGMQMEIPSVGPAICSACSVQWDKAEESGDIAVLYKANRKAFWKGAGTQLSTAPFWHRDPNDPNLKVMIMVRRETAPKPKRKR